MVNLFAWALTGLPDAQAQTTRLEQPQLPGLSQSMDDGPWALWTNPANLSFDPDPNAAMLYGQNIDGGPPQVSVASSANGLGVGLAYTGYDVGDHWTVSTGTGIRLDRNLTVGAHFGWQIPGGPNNNYTIWDLGAGYRPTHWLGLSGTAKNLGGARANTTVGQSYAGGLTLRPLGDWLMVGGEFTHFPSTLVENTIAGTVQLEPAEGLVVRGYLDDSGTVGAGLTLHFGGSAVLGYGATNADSTLAMGGVTTGPKEKQLVASGRKVAKFDFKAPLPYQPSPNIFGSAQGESYLGMLRRLEDAASDPTIRGIVLEIDANPFSFAQIEEVRGVLRSARKNDKPIIAYLNRETGNGAYLLACAADEIYMHPSSDLGLIGLSMELQFLRGTLDILGVEPQFVKRGAYKSAPEAMTQTGSSEANREQMNALLDDLAQSLVDGIAQARDRTTEQVWKDIDEGPYNADEAVERGLIDGIAYPEELDEHFQALFVDGHEIVKDYRVDRDTSGWRSSRELAVVYIDGAIVTGPSFGPGFLGRSRRAGSDTIVKHLDAARQDNTIKGVLIRVDSPGGSVFASDEIGRAIERLQGEKPVVVSMGGVAASGGYWVSADANAIFAEPSTITGSIGVFGGKMSTAGLFSKIGINTEYYTRGRNSNIYASSRAWDDIELATLDRLVGKTYDRFLEHVADGRGMKPEEVHEVAQGRVWSGRRAAEKGLVDELGGFSDALMYLKAQAGIAPDAQVPLIHYNDRFGTDDDLVRRTVGTVRSAFVQPQLPLPPEVGMVLDWRDLESQGAMAMLPYRLSIQ